MTTNIYFPFPDATGRIRCPRGVTFEIVDATARDAAVQAVRDRWDAARRIDDADLVDALENLVTGILAEALAEFGEEALLSGITADDEGVTVRMMTDDEREVGLPGLEIVTAPADRSLVARLERALGRSMTSTNAAWARALESAVVRVAEYSPHSRETVLLVVDRSIEMLAEEELVLEGKQEFPTSRLTVKGHGW